MRSLLVLLHRWFGLFSAVFLFIAGFTGALIAWDHEIDEWLNPQLFHADPPVTAEPLPALELANRVEAADARVRVGFMSLRTEPGHTHGMSVNARLDPATGKAYVLEYDQLGVHPGSGEIQGRRLWGALSLSREQIMPFLYKLHYSLHLPAISGLESGILLMGVVAVVWTLDSFIALWISFPNRKQWRKSFGFRLRSGARKLNFDLHRSGGVWLWPLVLVLAFTAVSMNLNRELMRPLVSLFSTISPNPFADREVSALPIEPLLTREQVLELARPEAVRRGITAPAGGIFYSPEFGLYGVGFYEGSDSHTNGGLGNPWLYFDGRDGHAAGAELPGTGSAGDVFLQAQFPLHSGRIAGSFGRILVTILGLAIATLSVTGVVIWAQKRRSRVWQSRREATAPPSSTTPLGSAAE
jgi:uncharacterized iron-regulated membrane protein